MNLTEKIKNSDMKKLIEEKGSICNALKSLGIKPNPYFYNIVRGLLTRASYHHAIGTLPICSNAARACYATPPHCKPRSISSPFSNKDRGESMHDRFFLDKNGLCPSMLDFTRVYKAGLEFEIFFETRPKCGYLRSNYSKTSLGVFACVCPGGINKDLSPVVRCLGCPVHTPDQSWPINNALESHAKSKLALTSSTVQHKAPPNPPQNQRNNPIAWLELD